MEDLFERKILIVDDEAINREILGNIIQSEYKVIYAENERVTDPVLSNLPACTFPQKRYVCNAHNYIDKSFATDIMKMKEAIL